MTSLSDKIKVILERKFDIENDIFIFLSLKALFTSKNSNPNEIQINIPEKKSKKFNELINKFVDLLYVLFAKDAENRNILYNKRINEINDVEIKEIINGIDIFNEFELDDEKYFKLYKVVLSLIRKENLLLIEDIRAIIFNISFITNNNMILNTLLYNLIYNKFIDNYEINFNNGEDSQIMINNDLCVNLIIKLFESEGKEDEYFLLIFSILIVRFESIERAIIGLDYSSIKLGIINTLNKIENDCDDEDNLFVEKIISSFCDEIEEINYNRYNNILSKETTNVDNSILFNSKNEFVLNLNYNNTDYTNRGNNYSSNINGILDNIIKIIKMEQIDKEKIINDVKDIKVLMNKLFEDNKMNWRNKLVL